MIGRPHNDRTCLGAITDEVVDLVESEDSPLTSIAEAHGTTANLIEWIQSLPQRDDTGIPCDGPKVEACRPAQRLRIPADDPNCVERAALYLGVAELIDPGPMRRLATVDTPAGPHTLPTEDGDPVVLDPITTRNALRAGLFHARRNGAGGAATPREAVDWVVSLAVEPARRFAGGPGRVARAALAMRDAIELRRGLSVSELRDVAFTLALAVREARLFGRAGERVVRTTARVLDRIDEGTTHRALTPRNAGLQFIGPQGQKVLEALGRVGGRVGLEVGVEALKVKLGDLGIGPPVLQSVERELNREGLTLGPLSGPPRPGSLGAMTPAALGRRIAKLV